MKVNANLRSTSGEAFTAVSKGLDTISTTFDLTNQLVETAALYVDTIHERALKRNHREKLIITDEEKTYCIERLFDTKLRNLQLTSDQDISNDEKQKIMKVVIKEVEEHFKKLDS